MWGPIECSEKPLVFYCFFTLLKITSLGQTVITHHYPRGDACYEGNNHRGSTSWQMH